MKSDEMLKIIRKAAEEADRKKNAMNEITAKDKKMEEWVEYEATYKAMLYCELINNKLDYRRISMENRSEAKKRSELERKRFDSFLTSLESFDSMCSSLTFILPLYTASAIQTASSPRLTDDLYNLSNFPKSPYTPTLLFTLRNPLVFSSTAISFTSST